jgi:hypothetical protein
VEGYGRCRNLMVPNGDDRASDGRRWSNSPPPQVTSHSCVKSSDQDPDVPESYGNEKTSKVYQVPVPLPEVYVVLIGRAHEPAGLYWEPLSVWSTKGQCQIEADKKQSETAQPDHDHGGNRNWPAFRCVVYKPTVKRAMGYDELPKE